MPAKVSGRGPPRALRRARPRPPGARRRPRRPTRRSTAPAIPGSSPGRGERGRPTLSVVATARGPASRCAPGGAAHTLDAGQGGARLRGELGRHVGGAGRGDDGAELEGVEVGEGDGEEGHGAKVRPGAPSSKSTSTRTAASGESCPSTAETAAPTNPGGRRARGAGPGPPRRPARMTLASARPCRAGPRSSLAPRSSLQPGGVPPACCYLARMHGAPELAGDLRRDGVLCHGDACDFEGGPHAAFRRARAPPRRCAGRAGGQPPASGTRAPRPLPAPRRARRPRRRRWSGRG